MNNAAILQTASKTLTARVAVIERNWAEGRYTPAQYLEANRKARLLHDVQTRRALGR